MFTIKGDTAGEQFFAFITNETNYLNISDMGYFDVNSFLRPTIPVKGRLARRFSSDLTQSDDIVLSVLSLLLMLLVESLVTTVLLCRKNGKLDNLRFAVKHTVDLLRELNITGAFSRASSSKDNSKFQRNRMAIFLAASILIFTTILDTMILFLTSQREEIMTNKSVTIRIRQPVLPKWDKVYHHFRGSWNRPCRAGSLDDVNERHTRIVVCIHSDHDVESPQLFERASKSVKVTITSRFHTYGADHDLQIGDGGDKLRTRAYFTLSDSRQRLMGANKGLQNEAEITDALHKLFISYLCSAYLRETEDVTMNLQRLNNFYINFQPLGSEFLEILPGILFRQRARVYRTTVEGVLPQGTAAFHVAQNFFGGAAALKLVDGDQHDFFLDSLREEEVEATVWAERIRFLNWLAILIILVIKILLLFLLRYFLKPVSMADVAGHFVAREVQVFHQRSPVEVSDCELASFRIGSWNMIEFQQGGAHDRHWPGDSKEDWSSLDSYSDF